MFGRRKKGQAEVDEAHDGPVDDDVPGGEPEDGAAEATTTPAPLVRPQGPWDVDDVPEDGVNRIDLGGLRVPVPPDTEVRVDVSPEGQVVAATLVRGESSMQVNAFAAPRSYGIWAEVREEIGATLREGGGSAEDVDGPWGVELHATVPAEGEGVPQAARFVGVDGPRWFLRALLTGPAATDRERAADLEAAFRDVVVARGSEAMAVRGPLPLRLPKEVTEQAPPAPETAELPQLQERGPEITERR